MPSCFYLLALSNRRSRDEIRERGDEERIEE